MSLCTRNRSKAEKYRYWSLVLCVLTVKKILKMTHNGIIKYHLTPYFLLMLVGYILTSCTTYRWVRRCLWNAATGLLFVPTSYMSMKSQWNDTDRGNQKLGEKSVPVPLCPPPILHGLIRAQTRDSAVSTFYLTLIDSIDSTVVRIYDVGAIRAPLKVAFKNVKTFIGAYFYTAEENIMASLRTFLKPGRWLVIVTCILKYERWRVIKIYVSSVVSQGILKAVRCNPSHL
jgi:hypothetical protein